MGWKIYRIWSTDWIKDPVAEGEKLLAAVEEAIETFGVDGFDATGSSATEDTANAEDFLCLLNFIRTLQCFRIIIV